MRKHWVGISIISLFVLAAILSRVLLKDEYLDVNHLKAHKEQLLSLVSAHYVTAAISFACLYLGTALFLPGALLLTVAGGMLFGVLPTIVLANIGATSGALLAFMLSRFLIGDWLQERFAEQLHRFNKEMSRHGPSYLMTLRILPIAPFFVINYCAGLTKIPLRTFFWTTSLGMLPGAFTYSFVGYQLRYVNAVGDLVSWKMILAVVLLSLFAMLPVIVHHLPAFKKP